MEGKEQFTQIVKFRNKDEHNNNIDNLTDAVRSLALFEEGFNNSKDVSSSCILHTKLELDQEGNFITSITIIFNEP